MTMMLLIVSFLDLEILQERIGGIALILLKFMIHY